MWPLYPFQLHTFFMTLFSTCQFRDPQPFNRQKWVWAEREWRNKAYYFKCVCCIQGDHQLWIWKLAVSISIYDLTFVSLDCKWKFASLYHWHFHLWQTQFETVSWFWNWVSYWPGHQSKTMWVPFCLDSVQPNCLVPSHSYSVKVF